MSARVAASRRCWVPALWMVAAVPLAGGCSGEGDGVTSRVAEDAGADVASEVRADAARPASMDAGAEATQGPDASAPDVDVPTDGAPADGPSDATAPPGDATVDSGPACEAGEGGTPSASRFVTRVVDFSPGPCAGFGASSYPAVVEGPPHGAGAGQGSTDVLSLGTGGSITLSFEPNAIVDGPGPDFLVFENPFAIGGDVTKPNAEPAEVSVSDDGTTWSTFPCTASAPPYGSCAGWHVVYANPANCVSPVDPNVAGGDPFDLHDLGLTHARYLRIVDQSGETCAGYPTNGFDLDAVALVNAERP